MKPSMNKPQGKPQVGESYAELRTQLKDHPASKLDRKEGFLAEVAAQNKDSMKSHITKPNYGQAQLAQTDGHGTPTSSSHIQV